MPRTIEEIRQELAEIAESIKPLNPDLAAAAALATVLGQVRDIVEETASIVKRATENMEKVHAGAETIRQLMAQGEELFQIGNGLIAEMADVNGKAKAIADELDVETVAAAVAATPAE